jgi:cell division protein FtsB
MSDSHLLDATAERKRARATLASRMVVIIATIVILLFSGFMAAVLVEIRQQSVVNAAAAVAAKDEARATSKIAARNAQVLRQVKILTENLKDCNTPEGECAKREAAQLASILGSVNSITFLAAACADRDGVQTEAEIRECVRRIVAHSDDE